MKGKIEVGRRPSAGPMADRRAHRLKTRAARYREAVADAMAELVDVAHVQAAAEGEPEVAEAVVETHSLRLARRAEGIERLGVLLVKAHGEAVTSGCPLVAALIRTARRELAAEAESVARELHHRSDR